MFNSKNVRKIVVLILLFILFITVKSFAIVSKTNEFYVNDYAGVLSEETKNIIVNTNIQLEKKTGAQIVIVTVNNLEGMSIEDYSTTLFRKFGIGDSKKDNGVLILFSKEDREVRIEVGYGLEGILPDGKTGRILDEYIIPSFKENNYDKGIKDGFGAVLNQVLKEYNVEIDTELNVNEYDINESKAEKIETLLVFGIPIVGIIIYMIIAKKRGISIFDSVNQSSNRSYSSYRNSSSIRTFKHRISRRRRLFRRRRS